MGKYISVSDVLSHAGYPNYVRLYQALSGDSKPGTISVSDLDRNHVAKPNHYVTFEWYNGMNQSPYMFHGSVLLMTFEEAVVCWLNMRYSAVKAAMSVENINRWLK